MSDNDVDYEGDDDEEEEGLVVQDTICLELIVL